MFMMFVDESGDPGYPRDGNWKNWGGSTHFARVGVVIHGWRWKGWNTRLMDFKKNNGLIWDAEIKAAHFRQGKGAFVGWDSQRRAFFFQSLLNLVGGNPDISLLGVIIDKKLVDTSKGDRLIKPEVRSLDLLLERYNLFLDRQRDKCGIVILDPVNESSDDNLRYFQSYLLTASEHMQPNHVVKVA